MREGNSSLVGGWKVVGRLLTKRGGLSCVWGFFILLRFGLMWVNMRIPYLHFPDTSRWRFYPY